MLNMMPLHIAVGILLVMTYYTLIINKASVIIISYHSEAHVYMVQLTFELCIVMMQYIATSHASYKM